MQKKILAAAVGAMLIAPAANAEVALYGIADVGLSLVDPGANYQGNDLFFGPNGMGTGGSRLGFRVSEDLGGGLQALAVMEVGFQIDSGEFDSGLVDLDADAVPDSQKVFQRQVFAGLGGGFGRVTVGRQYAEVFLVNTVGTYNSTGAGVGMWWLNRNTGVRYDNLIKYTSPAIGPGLTFAASYAPGEGTSAATENNGEFTEVAVKWGAGPLALAAAIGTSTANSTGTEVDTDITIVGANYELGPALTLYALYSSTENESAASAVNRTATSAGVKYTVGSNDFGFFYGVSADDRAGATDADSSLIGVRWDRWLSKKTNLFVAYNTLDNDTNAQQIVPRQAVGTTAAGEDPNQLSAGMVFRF